MTTFISERVLPVYVGIDVAKHKLDLARSGRPNILTVSNDRPGVRQILDELRRTRSVTVLYMAAVNAMRFNPVIRVVADRLLNAGKRNKVVIVACMRKLLVILNAMVRERLAWDQLNLVKPT